VEWYPHYLSDYAADTMGLSLAEDGAYRRLIDWYYLNERPLPADDQSLAAICRVSLAEWEAVSRVRNFFVTRDKNGTEKKVLNHKRIDATILSQSNKRRDWKARKEKHRKNGVLEPISRASRVTPMSVSLLEERRGEESIEDSRQTAATVDQKESKNLPLNTSENLTINQTPKSTESQTILTLAESIAAKAGKTAEIDRRRASGWVDDVKLIQGWLGQGFSLAEIEATACALIASTKSIKALWPFLAVAMPEQLAKAKTNDPAREQRLKALVYFADLTFDKNFKITAAKARPKASWTWNYPGPPPFKPGSDVPDAIALSVCQELGIDPKSAGAK
jgi:uncharacterized protein YdaU (DUF1376 family)